MNSSAPLWQIPEPGDVRDVRVDHDTVITLRRHGNPDGPRLIMSHGNGLAIDLYYPFWSLLAKDFDLVVYDLRNHGWNEPSTLENHNAPTLANDHDRIVEAVGDFFGEKPMTGLFHSLSAIISLLSPAKGREYSAMILFDPPLCKPGRDYKDFDIAATQAAAAARRRTEVFKSRTELIEVATVVPLYRRVLPGVVDLLAETTLRLDEEGSGYRLRCPREYEAQIVDYACVYAVTINFASFLCPIKVIGADPTLPFSYLPTMDLSGIVSVDYDFVPEATHFLQLEQPNECAAITRDFLKQISFV